MKRAILEWGLIVSVGILLAVTALWASSFYLGQPTAWFRVRTVPSLGNDLHMMLEGGNVSFADQFEMDNSGVARPMVVDPRTHVSPKLQRIGHATVPGFDLRYCQFAPDGYVVWSVRLSLLHLVGLLLVVAAYFVHRLRRMRARLSDGRQEGP